MSTISVNGTRVVTASFTFPFYGAWSADVVFDRVVEIENPATVVIGDLTLKGAVVRQASFGGQKSARIVGGAGGWRNTIPPKGYAHAAGVKMSTVLDDAARLVGETISIATDQTLGAHWVRDAAKAEKLLRVLLDGQWWIDPSGVTQTKARDATPISTPFTLIARSGAKGMFEIATEMISSWQPGRSFKAPTMPVSQTISSVTIEASNDGKLRLHVLSTEGSQERLRTDLRSIIRSELANLSFAGIWEYTIVAASETLVDIVPSDARMPSITKCSMMPSLSGEVVTPATGSKCRVAFVNEDPARPEVVGIVGPPTLIKFGGGADFIALAAKVLTELSSIQSQFNTHTHATAGMGAPSPPVVPMTSPNSVAATKVKAT